MLITESTVISRVNHTAVNHKNHPGQRIEAERVYIF